MNRSRLILILLVVIAFGACTRHNLEPRDYMAWVKDESNGLHVSKQVGQHTFELQYKPYAFEALLHQHGAAVTKAELNKAIESLGGLQYFTLTIRSEDKKDPAGSVSTDEADYNQRLNYLMFDMQQDFSLIDGSDTLPCVFYHYERNFNLSPENNILLGFGLPKKNITNDKTLFYNDQLLNTGPVLLTVKAADIAAVPSLKFPN